MNKRIMLLSSFVMIIMMSLSAQNLAVIKGRVDCGNVAYEKPVTAVFELQNKGRHKMTIDRVETSCGCISADYPRGEIAGHEKFKVQLTYDARMLGHFYKTAMITVGGSRQPQELVMTGNVLAELEDNAADYPYAFGNLRTDKNTIEFDNVSKGDNLKQEIAIYNNGTETLEPNLMHLPSYLTTSVMPERLSPGKSGKITVYLNSSKLRDYGLTQSKVNLAGTFGEKVSDDTEIPVSVVLIPDFMEMSETQKLNAPQLVLSAEQIEVDFGGKSKKRYDITLTNNGRSPLHIRSLQMFTGGMKVTLPKRRLAPGESTKLKITAYRDELKRVKGKPRVLMITNDPKKAKVVISLTPHS